MAMIDQAVEFGAKQVMGTALDKTIWHHRATRKQRHWTVKLPSTPSEITRKVNDGAGLQILTDES